MNFVKLAQAEASFPFKVIQSDNGSEFGGWFTNHINSVHRHSRVRRSNDNAHLERFNRTIQEECLDKIPRNIKDLNTAIPGYLKYYNEKRLQFRVEIADAITSSNSKVFPSY